ncbi:ArsR/SmtB family transcription factor [Haloarchaeobius salinus]|uniref:ArsR/SmtB family transcription factor n=1 Tax=Haloarchaeobius salinus TaxID=1198298 RepID=UPI00210DA6EB|nr:winged helix-turn-helix domain-containing protein [Haloarchaeobius salinus]
MVGKQLRRSPERREDESTPRGSATARAGAACDQTERRFTAEDDDASDILELLDDDYARRILEVLEDGPLPARALVDRCEASKPTVYRRLNRLEEQGFVSVDIDIDRDGHHRKVFESTLVSATFELDGGTAAVQVTVEAASAGPGSKLIPPSD